jgi:CheY-like chemotaxis protein
MQAATVMVVDDEIPYCEVMQDILHSYGYRVITANNAQEAWELLKDNQPDLILMDIMMPVLDGFRFTQQLAMDPARSEIPILIVSAKSSREDRLRAQEAGAKGFLQKPFTSKELREALASTLPSSGIS